MTRQTRNPVQRLWLFLLLLSLALPQAAWPQNGPLQRLFTDYYEFHLREDPSLATFVGRSDYNDRWDDPSPEHLAERRQGLQRLLRRLTAIRETTLRGQNRLSYRLLDWQLRQEIQEIETVSTYNAVSHMVGGHLAVFSTMAVAPAATVKDYENQVARLRALPRWVDQTIAAASHAIDERKIQPRLVAERVTGQLDLEMEPDAAHSPLLKAFRNFPASIPAAEQERLSTAAADAYTGAFQPAWHKLRDYVAGPYRSAARETLGVTQIPGGPAMYAFLVKRMTTTGYTPEQIHEIGLKEVARIQREMAAIRTELNFTGSAEEFSNQVLNAPRFRFHSEEEILMHARDIAKRIDPELPRLFKTLPRTPYGVSPLPPDRARTSPPYYEEPALDGSRAGYFYLRTADPENESSCCTEATILHESVPGHHLQIALAHEIEGVPEFRKIAAFTAYVEGWALYAETLGAALNMYETPYEKYGQLQSELFRAGRLVVDTGIHTKGWSREQAIDYLYGSGADPSREFMASEVDRYIAWPGQALAYKIGQLKIQELRTAAQKQWGARFDVREFHDVVLRNGALPLDILEEQVRAWIAQAVARAR